MKAILIFLGVFTILIYSCRKNDYYPCVKPQGSSVEEVRSVAYFSGIELAIHANVYITAGESLSVLVEAPANIHEFITTETRGNTLLIDNTRCLKTKTNDITVYITVSELAALRIAGSGNIYAEDAFEGGNIQTVVSGSGNIFLQGNFEKVSSTISGSGNINLMGTCIEQQIHISGSGQVSAEGFQCDNAKIYIAGSGNARVHVDEYLEVNIAGSGSVFYAGSPQIRSTITGSGKIIPLTL